MLMKIPALQLPGRLRCSWNGSGGYLMATAVCAWYIDSITQTRTAPHTASVAKFNAKAVHHIYDAERFHERSHLPNTFRNPRPLSSLSLHSVRVAHHGTIQIRIALYHEMLIYHPRPPEPHPSLYRHTHPTQTHKHFTSTLTKPTTDVVTTSRCAVLVSKRGNHSPGIKRRHRTSNPTRTSTVRMTPTTSPCHFMVS